MFHWIYSLFIVLHGLVHLLYLAWSQGRLLPEEGFEFTGESWLFTNLLGPQTTRTLGMILFAVTALLFVAAGIGLATRQGWAPNWLAISAIVSSLVILVMWDGKLTALDQKGFIGALINIAIVVGIYIFKYPAF